MSAVGQGGTPHRHALLSSSVCARSSSVAEQILLAAAKEEFNSLLEMEVIQPSDSPWSSPLHMVEKPSGGWRACGDHRALNATSEDDRYPMSHLQDFTIQLEGKGIFSWVDFVGAYNQLPMNASDIAKTAIVTSFGFFLNINVCHLDSIMRPRFFNV